MAVFELPALDGAGDQIADRGEEPRVLRAELALFVGADAEDAVGAAVAAGDRGADAADAAMIGQILRDREPRLGGEIRYDDGDGRIERVARIEAVVARGDDGTDETRLPAETGAQQEVGIAGQQFEHLDEIDRQRRRDRIDNVAQQRVEIAFHQGTLAELGERLLLSDAVAQFRLEIDPFSHVLADSYHAHGRAVLDLHGSQRLDPALLATLPRRDAVTHPVRSPGAQRLVDGTGDLVAVLFVDLAREERVGAVEAAGREAMNGLEIARPGHRVGRDVP